MSWDPVWEEVFRSQAWGKYPAEPLVRFIAWNFYKCKDRKSIKILDVGCGPGANLWYMAREGFTVYGVDGSKAAVEQANKRLNEEVPGWSGEVLLSDILNLPYEDGFFDAVVDSEAVYANSYKASKNIYKEMYRVTKPNGKIFSRTFASGCVGDGTGEKIEKNGWLCDVGPLGGKGFSRFTAEEEVLDLLGDYKLDNLEQTSWTLDQRKMKVIEWLITGSKK